MKRMLMELLCLMGLLMANAELSAQPGKVYKSLDEVTDPGEVYALQLHGKRLRRVPGIVYSMTNLRDLDLRGNKIAYLSDSIAMLVNLQRLEVSRNPLMEVPAAMAEMKSLRELVLWDTYVNAVPEEFARLDGQLQLLDLRSCPLMLDDQKLIDKILPSTKKKWDYACNCTD